MDTCAVCGAWFVEGEPCEVCGHVVDAVTPTLPSDPRSRAAEPEVQPEPTPAPPSPSPSPSPSPVKRIQEQVASDDGPKPVVVLAACAAAFMLAVGFSMVFLFSGDDSDSPDTLAAVDQGTNGPPAGVPDSFCDAPGPVPGAPVPDPDGANLFTTFEKLGALPFEQGVTEGMFDAQWFAQDYPELRLTSIVPTEPSYALCFVGLGNGEDRVCAGYGSGGQFEIYGAEWTMSLYELASGEALLADIPVRSEISVCPDVRPTLSRNQGPRPSQVRQLTAFAALPGHYTAIHLTQDLDGGATTWCDTPSPVRNVGSKAASPAVFLVTNGSQALRTAEAMVATSTIDVDQVTHVACLRHTADPSDRELTCTYANESLVKFQRGTYTVTIVEASTGQVVDQRTFDSDVSCPEVFDFAHVRVHTLRGALPAGAAAWIDSVVGVPAAEEETDEEETDEEEGSQEGAPAEAVDAD